MATEQERTERLLQRLIGEWTLENDISAAPGSVPMRYTGTESVRALGGTWVVSESRTTHPPEAASVMLTTLGFDAARGRVVGAVATSMMSCLWVYDGSLDAPLFARRIRESVTPEAGLAAPDDKNRIRIAQRV